MKHRLALLGVLVASLPFPFMAIVSRHAGVPVAAAARSGLTSSDLDHLVDAAFERVEFSRQELSDTLSVAGRMLSEDHGVRQLKGHPVAWPVAGNHPVKLPLLSLRKTLLQPSANSRHTFVSECSSLSGAQCSVFQRMNSTGDMLWVATSLPGSASRQAIGTVLPASDPETRAALDRQPYLGPVSLAGDRILMGFKPISRADGFVIGMLAVSRPESAEADQIRHALSRVRAGLHGELFAGETSLPIPPEALPEILQAAKNQPAKTVEARYRVSSGSDMLAHVRYFAPWNWLVGVTVPQSEMAVVPALASTPPDQTSEAIGVIFLLTVALSAAVWWQCSSYLASPILSAQEKIKDHVDRLLGIAGQASQPPLSRRRAAAQVELAAASAAEAGRAANLMLTGVGETMLSTRECTAHAANACAELDALHAAMAGLTASNSQVSGLVKDIAGIALQSRLLALNASIEAARAGHHGASFSVVADEFGNLAQRCSENAKTTTALLTNSVAISTASTEHLVRLGSEIREFSHRSESAAHGITQLLEAGNDQAKTLARLERSLQQFDTAQAATIEFPLEIRAEAAGLEKTAAEIARAVSGPRKSKQRAPKSHSSGVKAPADTRSVRRAC